MKKAYKKPTAEMIKLLRQTASTDLGESQKAMQALAQGLTEPIRKGILEGDTLGDTFDRVDLTPGAESKFALDIMAPGTENDHVAFTMPDQAKIPMRHVEGSEVWVPTFDIANSVDWNLSFARDARWDVVSRATEILIKGITERMNDDGWHVLLASAASNATVVQDGAATAGEFTRRVLNAAKTTMIRKAPGEGIELTDLYMSPESFEDIRDWDNTELDEQTRREVFTDRNGGLAGFYGVNLHQLKKLGEGQAYQSFIVDTLGIALSGGDLEFAIGLDLGRNDSFVMPVREDSDVFDDPALHRNRKAGIYKWMTLGFGSLDSRSAQLLSW